MQSLLISIAAIQHKGMILTRPTHAVLLACCSILWTHGCVLQLGFCCNPCCTTRPHQPCTMEGQSCQLIAGAAACIALVLLHCAISAAVFDSAVLLCCQFMQFLMDLHVTQHGTVVVEARAIIAQHGVPCNSYSITHRWLPATIVTVMLCTVPIID